MPPATDMAVPAFGACASIPPPRLRFHRRTYSSPVPMMSCAAGGAWQVHAALAGAVGTTWLDPGWRRVRRCPAATCSRWRLREPLNRQAKFDQLAAGDRERLEEPAGSRQRFTSLPTPELGLCTCLVRLHRAWEDAPRWSFMSFAPAPSSLARHYRLDRCSLRVTRARAGYAQPPSGTTRRMRLSAAEQPGWSVFFPVSTPHRPALPVSPCPERNDGRR